MVRHNAGACVSEAGGTLWVACVGLRLSGELRARTDRFRSHLPKIVAEVKGDRTAQ